MAWAVIGLIVTGCVIAAILIASTQTTSDVDAVQVSDVTVSVAGSVLPRQVDSGADPAAGLKAPSVDGVAPDGTPVSIAAGRPTVVAFMAHWCPICQTEVVSLARWFAENGVTEDVDVVTVATFVDPARANYPPGAWLARENWPFPTLLDTDANRVAEAYGIAAVPSFVAIGSDGTVLARLSGELGPETFAALLTATAAEFDQTNAAD